MQFYKISLNRSFAGQDTVQVLNYEKRAVNDREQQM